MINKSSLKSLLVGLGVFGVIAVLLVTQRHTTMLRERQVAATNADRAVEVLRGGVDTVLQQLDSVGTVAQRAFLGGGSPTAEFHAYVRDTDVLDNNPIMSAIAFMHYGTDAEVDRAIATYNIDPERSKNGYPPLALFPPSDLTEHAFVAMIQPKTLIGEKAGFDIMVTPRRGALEQAITQRGPHMTEQIELFTQEPGVAIYHPVYLRDSDAKPIGFTATAFATQGFLDALEDSLAPLDLDIHIHDLGLASSPRPAASDKTLLMIRHADNPDQDHRSGVIKQADMQQDITIAGRTWRIIMHSTKPMVAAPDFASYLDGFMLLGALTGFLAGFAHHLTARSEQKLNRMVAARTGDLLAASDELRSQREAAEHAAAHDDLTGLLNRRGLRNTLRAAGASSSQTTYAMIMMDLDGFKDINDTMGHPFGDLVLNEVATAISRGTPNGALIARLGGDEFAVLLTDVDKDAAIRIAHDCIKDISDIRVVNGTAVRIGASAGVALHHFGDRMLSALMGNADIALYKAKRAGRGTVATFDTSTRRQVVARKTLADDLHRAIGNGEFLPFYQTQHEAVTHKIAGVEALVRWDHPKRGILPPSAFLDVAEQISLLKEIDRQMLHHAARDMQWLQTHGMCLPKLNVNVSLSRLTDTNLFTSLDALPQLDTTLCFEVLETIFIDRIDDALGFALDQLGERGIVLEIDDFGSGRASILAMTMLQPTRIKIDQGLVTDATRGSQKAKVLASIISMARELGVGTTAEGVETADEVTLLHELGIGAMQGYHFSKPVGLIDLQSLIRRHGIAQPDPKRIIA